MKDSRRTGGLLAVLLTVEQLTTNPDGSPALCSSFRPRLVGKQPIVTRIVRSYIRRIPNALPTDHALVVDLDGHFGPFPALLSMSPPLRLFEELTLAMQASQSLQLQSPSNSEALTHQ